EIGCIDQNMTIRLGGYRKAPQHRFGDGILDGALFGQIGARGSEGFSVLDEQQLLTDALERDDPTTAFLAAIQPEVVRTQAGSESCGVEELGVEARDLEVEVAGAFFPVEREIAVEFLHRDDAIFDGGQPTGRALCASAASLLCSKWSKGETQNGGENDSSDHC